MSNAIVVIGSLSLDMVFDVPRRPGRGETIKGKSFQTFVGGKGNNQALAAAKAGAQVAMVGRVGNDSYADLIIDTLKQTGVDVSHLVKDKEIGTGLANIYIDPEGDNSIVIVPRSNDRLSPEDIDRAIETIKKSKIALLQLEVPMDTVIYAARVCNQAGVKVLLNPAPAPADGDLPDELLENVDIMVPNETEAALLTNIEITDAASALVAANNLLARGVKSVFVTLGEKGVAGYTEDGTELSVPAYKVNAKDTTAAGDAFVGALAARLSKGDDVATAMKYACAAGALATTKMGAAASLPDAKEIEQVVLSCQVV